MKIKSRNKHLWIDAGLFAGFLLAFWLDLTGLALHQWLGVALAAMALYHLLLHQKWVEVVSERFFGRTSLQARRYYLLDVLLMAGFTVISFTGLLISSWLNLPLDGFDILRQLHVWSSILTAGLVVLKIALHGGWITQALRRSFGRERGGAAAGPAPRALQSPLNAERRAFLKLVGVTGAATLIAVSQAFPGAVEALAGDAAQADEQESAQASWLANVQSSASSSGCEVRCDKRCAYPGHCRRYTDSNGNGRCDLGECL